MNTMLVQFTLLMGMGCVAHAGNDVLCWKIVKKSAGNGECEMVQAGKTGKSECCSNPNHGYTALNGVNGQETRVKILPNIKQDCKLCSGAGSCPVQPKCSDECGVDCKNTHDGKVCGSDFNTYDTECDLKKKNCGKAVTMNYKGECKADCKGVVCAVGKHCYVLEDKKSICLAKDCSHADKSPTKLCGLNGITYNSRHALCEAGMLQHKLWVPAYGDACKANPTCNDIKCGKDEKCIAKKELKSKVRCVKCEWSNGRGIVCVNDKKEG